MHRSYHVCLGLLWFFGGYCVECTEASTGVSSQPTEEEWILEEIVMGMAELTALAAKQELAEMEVGATLQGKPDDQKRRYQVDLNWTGLPTIKATLQPENTYVWDPALYLLVGVDMLKALKLKAQPTTPDNQLAERLLELTPETLQKENRRLSEELSENPLSPQLQEEAALLVAAFLFREQAWKFEEMRQQMNLLTVHLAMAAGLSKEGKLGVNGQLAKWIGATMVHRAQPDKSGFAKLKKQHPKYPGLAAWYQACLIRSTDDPNRIKDLSKVSLAEQLAHAIALARIRLKTEIIRLLDRGEITVLAQHTRPLVFAGIGMSYGQGATQAALNLELAEAEKIWRLHEPSAPATLNQIKIGGAGQPPWQRRIEPGAVVWMAKHQPEGMSIQDGKITVLGPGLWSSFAQRHLFYVLERFHFFLDDQRAAFQAAADFSSFWNHQLSRLPLQPLLEIAFAQHRGRESMSSQRDYEAALEGLRPIAKRAPEMIPPNMISQANSFYSVEYEIPNFPIWYHYRSPAGTGFNLPTRIELAASKEEKKQLVQEAWERVPDSSFFVIEKMEVADRGRPSQEFLQQLRRSPAYASGRVQDSLMNLPGIREVPSVYEPLMEERTRRSPILLFRYGQHFSLKGDKARANQIFERALKEWDRGKLGNVAASNQAFRAMRHYGDQGEWAKAEEFVRRALTARSYAAYRDAGLLAERKGDDAKAEDYFKTLAGRYRDPSELLAFYLRMKDAGKMSFHQTGQALLERVFPQGIEPINLEALTQRPTSGVILNTRDPLQDDGLPPGAIIVGVDGMAIEDESQFDTLVVRDRSDTITLQYYDPQAKAYDEVTLTDSITQPNRLTDNPRRILFWYGRTAF